MLKHIATAALVVELSATCAANLFVPDCSRFGALSGPATLEFV